MSQQQEYALGSSPTWAEQTGAGVGGSTFHQTVHFSKKCLAKRPTGALQKQQMHLIFSLQHQVFIYRSKCFAKDLT